MKYFFIALMMALPLLTSAQDNTWERIELEPVEKDNPDAQYLREDAVPLINGKVGWQTTIEAPGKSADEIYTILLKQLTQMTTEPNQLENSDVSLQDTVEHKLGAAFHEWLVFKSGALSLDRTKFNFQIMCTCYDGKVDVLLTRIVYLYDTERTPMKYYAEDWITDEYCVNKKHTRLLPISGKFRRKTIDRKNFIFNKFNTLINGNK